MLQICSQKKKKNLEGSVQMGPFIPASVAQKTGKMTCYLRSTALFSPTLLAVFINALVRSTPAAPSFAVYKKICENLNYVQLQLTKSAK